MNVIPSTSRALEAIARVKMRVLEAAPAILRAGIEAAEASAKATTLFQDRTGETRGSIRGEAQGLTGFVQAGGSAGFLENGTHHPEQSGKLWVFVMNGQTIFTRKIREYEIAPRPFMHQAIDLGELAAFAAAETFLTAAIR